jgi:hypothetical protein
MSESRNHPSDFTTALFSPSREFIWAYILTLFTITLWGNLLYSILIESNELELARAFLTFAVGAFMLLVAGFLWENRPRPTVFTFQSGKRLGQYPVLFVVPSGQIKENTKLNAEKLIEHHKETLKYVWVLGDTSMDNNAKYIQTICEARKIAYKRTIIQGSDYESGYTGVKEAWIEANNLALADDGIVVDITGGTKPLTIGMMFASMEFKLRMSYTQSQYQQQSGENNIELRDVFEVFELDLTDLPFKIQHDTAINRAD